jgi:hypothetical protein
MDRRMPLLLVLLILFLPVAACSPAPPASTASSTTAQSSTTVARSTTSSTGSATAAQVCAGDIPPFYQDGPLDPVGSADADAAVVGPVTWETHRECERLHIEFATREGAPAVTPPLVRTEFLRDSALVRLTFPSGIDASSIAHEIVSTDLMRGFYVVRALDGSTFVDLHLAAPCFVRVQTEASPAAIDVDLIPGGPPPSHPALAADDVVVVQPTGGDVAYPITVLGYALSDRAGVTASLVTGDATFRTESLVAEDTTMWGAFAMVFPNGGTGPVTLTVEGGPEIALNVP